MSKTLKKLLSFILTLSLLCTNFAFAEDGMMSPEDDMQAVMDKAEQDREYAEELRGKYEYLQNSLQSVQSQLQNAEAQKNYALNKRAAVKAEIALIQEQLDNLLKQKNALNEKITQQEINIANKEMEIEESQTRFEYRLAASQASGSTDFWTMLFSASTFSEFLTSLETIRQFAQYDTELIKTLKNGKAELEKMAEELETDRKELEEKEAEFAEKQKALDSKYSELNGQVYSLEALAQQYKQNAAAIQESLEAAQNDLAAFYAGYVSNGNYVGGEFITPVIIPGGAYISSRYGYRSFNGYSDFHTGIDFTGAGCYGNAIVAANSGTVSLVKSTYIPGKGYGKYLIVDHGGGKSTLYAHCSNIAVSVGQQVMQGQTIAYIGSTGFSTGAHLHFEIRINGQHVNPLEYLPGWQ